MTTWQGMLAAAGQIVDENYHYDNSIPGRCLPQLHGLDCATFYALAINRAGGTIDPCTNSWAVMTRCKQAPRPDWLTELSGPGLGLQIPQEIALAWPGTSWFHSTGAGHIEIGTGTSGGLPGSVGAHGHATGIGYSHWFPGFFDFYAIDPILLESFRLTYDPASQWKVQPVYNPPLQVVDFLSNDAGGTWLLLPNFAVIYTKAGQPTLIGGMITPADARAVQGRTPAKLEPRTYGHPPKPGYTIQATSGELYVPSTQH